MTDRFIEYIFSLVENKIDPLTYRASVKCFIDYLAVTLCGAKSLSDKKKQYIDSIVGGCGDATVIGTGEKSDMQTAALMNGMNSHVLELDDGHRKGALHVGGTVFSALLAVAEKENLGSEDFWLGAIVGYEATVRLACAIQPGNKLKGYHATGTCGTVGAAVGIAAALKFSREQMKSALSAAVTCAAGVLEMQEDNSDYKPLNVGRAAMDAVAAAYLGRAGFVPPSDALGGKRGFLKVMTDDPKVEYLTEFDLSAQLAINQVYMKTYASCRHTHPAVEAALYLRGKHSINACDIKSVEVEAYRLAVAGHDHTCVLGVSSAKMSMPFSVALALYRGSAGMEDFNDSTVKDQAILSLAKRVTVRENGELSSWVPAKRASILHITLNDGTVLSHQVDYPKGEPENPLSESELHGKFTSLAASAGYGHDRCSEIIEFINTPSFAIRDLMEKIK